MSTTRSTLFIFLNFLSFSGKYFLCSFLGLLWGYDDPLVFSNNFYKIKIFNNSNSKSQSLDDFIKLNTVFLTRKDIKKILIFSALNTVDNLKI